MTTTSNAAGSNASVANAAEMASPTAGQGSGKLAATEGGVEDTPVVFHHDGPAQGASSVAAVSNTPPDLVQNPPVVPFVVGKNYTISTPPNGFEDWVDYLLFCDECPKIRILCAKEIVNNRCVAFSSIVMSEKLLRDHSEYFAALARGPWREARSCVLRLPEIRIEDFKRLELTLVAGGAASRNNIGKPTAVITNLVETYLLADYFAMPVVQAWLKASLDDYFVEHRAWSALYVNQILDPAASARTPSAEQMHKDKVLDFCTAFDRLQQLAPEQQIISIDNLIRYLCSHCPRPLMSSVVESLGLELIRLCFSAYLLI